MKTFSAPLLIEVGTEELPPGNLTEISLEFSQIISKSLNDLGFTFDKTEAFSTPRRLAVRLSNIENIQPDREIIRRGPALQSAFDKENKPTKATLGFAKSCNVSFENLEKTATDKGTWLSFTQKIPGKPLVEILSEIIEQSLNKLKFTKRMRWSNNDFAFSRPIHWICAIHDKNPLKISVFNLFSIDHSYGHRIHSNGKCEISTANDYEKQLKKAYVIVCPAERKKIIEQESNKIAEKINGYPVLDPDLINIATNLVEWPVPLLGKFSEKFLSVPAEALISSMQNHQKCLPIRNSSQQLMPYFILISNLDAHPNTEIIRGNERVMKARLEDAAFFFAKDQKKPLKENIKELKKVIFHKKLGSLYDKSVRTSKLAKFIAEKINTNPEHAEQAAMLSKADLLTNMVYEFPELQGIMGHQYARINAENSEIALAIEEAYWPKFSGDKLPTSLCGACLALAERIDTIVGIFGIGLIPTGEKDPFALKRASIAILRIIIEKKLNLDLKELINKSIKSYDKLVDPKVLPQVLTFCIERLNAWYSDKGLDLKVLDAVLANKLTSPIDIHERIMAVDEFRKLPEAQSLAQANKRVRNILNKSGIALNMHELPPIDAKLLTESAERSLANELESLEEQIYPLIEQGKYEKSLKLLANLQKPVDVFFDEVMVMSEDESTKQNRINLVSHLNAIFLKIADISRLAL
jgi:glycyl-tRNA synthetase beta chain